MLRPWIGAATPVTRIKGSIPASVPDQTTHVRQLARDRGGRSHGRAHQVRPSTGPLATNEVAVGGGRAALLGADGVAVDGRTHGAARIPPFESGLLEDAVEALCLRRLLHQAG